MQRFLPSISRSVALIAAGLLPVTALAQAPSITAFSPTTGKAGTSITITGLNLSTSTAVLLNGQSLRITNKLATSLTVTVPAAASTGKLVVTNPSGSAVATTQFGVTRSSSGTNFRQLTAKGTSFNNIRVTISANMTNYGTVYYSTPTVTDLAGNGRADLLIGNGNGNIEYYAQSAVSSASYSKIGNLKVGGNDIKVSNFAKPTVADIDGNGKLDLLVGTGDTRRIARYEQASAGSIDFVNMGNLQSGGADLVTGANFPRPTIADLDGNGRLDLLIGDYSGVIKRYEATGVGSVAFGAGANVLDENGAAIKVDGTSTTGTSKPLLFDLDGNGLLDLILGSAAGAVTRYEQTQRYALTFKLVGNLLNDSNGAINMGTSGNAEGGYAAPLVTDIDDNGNLDLLIGDMNGTIYRYEQVQATPLAASPLPVTLTSFTGQTTTGGALLRWTTAQELNSAKFVVERSEDGTTFKAVGEVAAAGTTAAARTYQFQDASPASGLRYYRLRQVDFDGTTAYSGIVALSRATAPLGAVTAYPNPFTNELLVALPAGLAPQSATVTLTSVAGTTVYSATLSLSGQPQALPALPALQPGMYVLRLTTAAGTTTQRVSHR